MERLRAKGRRAWLHWRGDQLSALALETLRSSHEAEVVGLLVSEDLARAEGGVRAELRPLLTEQAASLELPLHWVSPAAEPEREARLQALAEQARALDVRGLALPAVRSTAARARGEAWARGLGLVPVFPLLGEEPARLAQVLIERGFRSVVHEIDLRRLPHHVLGRTYSASLLAELSPELDPLGEDGLFDTFVCGGPGLQRPISPRLMDMIEAEGSYRAVLGPGPKRAYGDV